SVTIASTGTRWRERWKCTPHLYVPTPRLLVPETRVAPHLPHRPTDDSRNFGWLPCLAARLSSSCSFATAARELRSMTRCWKALPRTGNSSPGGYFLPYPA